MRGVVFFEAPLNSELTVDAILMLKNKLRCEVFHSNEAGKGFICDM